MDSLGLDVYHTDYQEKQREAEAEVLHTSSPPEESEDRSSSSSEGARAPSSQDSPALHPYPSAPESSPSQPESIRDSVYYVSSELASGETVPVGGAEAEGGKPHNVSTKSSTSSSSSDNSRNFGTTSLYQQDFMAPKMNYDRENERQKLVAVVGREFDRPYDVAMSLQRLVPRQPECTSGDVPLAKFVPFTLKRKVLLKGSFDSQELRRHDLICMCYNASEARILLTGEDGFYSSLLRHVESLLGKEGRDIV